MSLTTGLDYEGFYFKNPPGRRPDDKLTISAPENATLREELGVTVLIYAPGVTICNYQLIAND